MNHEQDGMSNTGPVQRGLDVLAPPADGSRRAEGGLRLSDPQRCRTAGLGQPLVSYVTVVRNACNTLPRTLASVRAQSWPAVEHIVVDGLSDDGTLAVIQAHAAQIDYYVSEADAGLYEAMNKAVQLARGELICVLNADDWLTDDAAAVAARALVQRTAGARDAGAWVILTSAWLHNGRRRRLWLPGPLHAGSWLSCPNICHNAVYATPAALAATGPYDTRLRIVADSRWLLGMVDAAVPSIRVAAPTVHYVTGGVSGDVTRHVEDCARLLALRFTRLSEDEVWTLLHAFYPWTGNLAPFAARCPPDLGQALQALATRHADDGALQTSLQAAGMARQLGQARRVRARKPLAVAAARAFWRAWYALR
jgi:Glycosyl transferase family 2